MGSTTVSPSARLRLPKGDRWAVIVLIAIPVVMFGVPAAIGHPVAPGDDSIQNFPLRVLVGHQLAAGHLPTFDPYIWGGAPLLGGWNAGALYPFTFLFAIFPPNPAWALNEIITYAVAGLGLYTFLRILPLAALPSALGAATFAFAGAMDVHLAHFGLVAGMSWIPLILVAMVKLSRHTTAVGRALWIGLLGTVGALSVLAGEPRAIDATVIVSALYFLWLVARLRRRALPFIVSVGAGAVVAILIGAVQWLPGAMAVSTSQRAHDTYNLFASGSLSPRWLFLLLVPGLLGGSGSFGTAAWFTGYNLPEVMGYVGLLPAVAAVALLGKLRLRRPLPDWLVWHIIGLVGVVLAIGSFSPLGHFLSAIPLFGGQRLQSRNIAITDLALAVLLAYWVDDVLKRPTGERVRIRHFGTTERTRYLALVPLVAAALLAAAALASPVSVATHLAATGPRLEHALAQRPLFVVTLVLVAATAAVVILVGRHAPGRRAWVLAVLVLVDLVAFNATDVWTIAPRLGDKAVAGAPTYGPGVSPTPLVGVRGIGTTGRFAMYDPSGVIDNPLRAISSPDLNVLNDLYSVQGYSSIVYGPYAEATGSHAAEGMGYNALAPAAVQNGLLDQLDTTTLVTSPRYLVTGRTGAEAAPLPPVGHRGPGSRVLGAAGEATWAFGETIDVSSISLPWVANGAPAADARWRVGLVQPGGGTVWQTATFSTTSVGMDIELSRPSPAVGVRIKESGAAGTTGAPVITTARHTYLAADGALEAALVSQWRFAGNQGPLSYFTNLHAVRPLSLRPLPGASLGAVTVRAQSGPRLEPTTATVATGHGAELVRAVAMIPGWTATWTPSTGGASRTLAVRRTGLVQAVDVPPGRGVVTWRYRAPGFKTGLLLTLVGVILLAGVVGGALVARRRLRPEARLRMARESVPN